MPKTIKQRCDEIGIALPTYYLRLRQGMTKEEALSTPPRSGRGRTRQPKPTEPVEPGKGAVIFERQSRDVIFETDFQERRKQAAAKARRTIEAKKEAAKGNPQLAELMTAKDILKNYRNATAPRKVPYYGPAACADKPFDERSFDKACGGYVATICNHVKEGEFKYQIVSTYGGTKIYTNDLIRFINEIVKICDPTGRTNLKVMEKKYAD